MNDKMLLKKLTDLTNTVEKLSVEVFSNNSPRNPHPGDHDLLLRIDTKVERVIVDVQKLSDNFAHRIDLLETDKTNKVDSDKTQKDHEDRIRSVEKFQENLIGKFSIITVAISIIIVLITGWFKSKFGI